MEPKSYSPELNASTPGGSPESLPNLPNPENAPEVPLTTPEHAPVASPERAPEQSTHAQASMAAQPIPISLPTPVPVQSDDATLAAVDDNLPSVAGDDDLIEKEWVDKAKKIIADTKDDPAQREKAVGRLQADYLKKRYGKELGAS